MNIKLISEEPVEYITRRAHGHHPPGSKCLAHRKDFGRILVLTFYDGFVVEYIDRYLVGIEEELSLTEEEDLRFFNILDKIANFEKQ